jgi:hypothetical protein
MPGVNVFAFETYTVTGWQPGDVYAEQTKWGTPEELAVKRLDEEVQRALGAGEQVEHLDGLIRVRMWQKTEMLPPDGTLPTRWPDAMATWHKPDTSILDAAVEQAAILWRHCQDHPDSQPSRTMYDGAVKTVQRVHDAHRKLIDNWKGPSAVEMIELAAALLPDHR